MVPQSRCRYAVHHKGKLDAAAIYVQEGRSHSRSTGGPVAKATIACAR